MDEDMYRDLWLFAMKVAKAIKKTVPCIKVGVAVIGLEVPHAHIHLVPLNSMDDINFSRPKLTLPVEELKQISAAISASVKG